mmetsp:Transcript_1849/g.4504  ORF Transcript_1849/g.4504 Transcript_1849/m.4504 type:complete len:413 (+) Transcript_1849:2-1240(+)
MAMEHKHGLAHFLGPGDEEWASAKAKENQHSAFEYVEKELLDGDIVSKALDKAAESRVLGSQMTKDWRDRVAAMAARRNFLQVRRADAVYVVGWRLAQGRDQFTGKSEIDPRETPALDVGGGTGWACQWYVDRFASGGEDPALCKLYFFDDAGPPWARKDPATEGKWSRWSTKSNAWETLEQDPPKPDGLYAGIGATRLSERAEIAIRSLYPEVKPAPVPDPILAPPTALEVHLVEDCTGDFRIMPSCGWTAIHSKFAKPEEVKPPLAPEPPALALAPEPPAPPPAPEPPALAPAQEPPARAVEPVPPSTPEDVPVKETCHVKFFCNRTAPGDSLAIVGADAVLGAWDTAKHVLLSAATYPIWSADIKVPADGSEFKLVIVRSNGKVDWEGNDNRIWPSTIPEGPIASFGCP